MTITQPTHKLEQCEYVHYHFVKEMNARQVIDLYQYLHQAHEAYRDQPNRMTEIWDFGISMCRERLKELKYRFVNIRSGYPDMIQAPDGKVFNYLPA